MSLRPAVFLDRDGTLNASITRGGKPYPPASIEEFRLLDGVKIGCTKLKAAGYRLIVVTNQPDVGRGTQSRAAVEAIHATLEGMIPELDLIKVCYHAGEEYGDPCNCRKPEPGMILEAAEELGLDLAQSWMVGDRWRDIDCGASLGIRTIFLECGYTEALRTAPDFIVSSFNFVPGIILAQP